MRRDVCFDGKLIAARGCGGETYDAGGCYVIPGLTDLHFHGCMGRDFSDADAEGLEIMAKYELSRGVTQICPAGMTLPEEQLLKSLRCGGGSPRRGKGRGGARRRQSRGALPLNGQEGRAERRMAPRAGRRNVPPPGRSGARAGEARLHSPGGAGSDGIHRGRRGRGHRVTGAHDGRLRHGDGGIQARRARGNAPLQNAIASLHPPRSRRRGRSLRLAPGEGGANL